MKALYFGTYDRAYPRNAQVISSLRRVGVDVRELHQPLWEGRHNWSLGPGQLVRVVAAERRLRREQDHEAEVLIVGYPGHFDMTAGLRVARGRPVVFNPLVSLHDTLVGDRGRFKRGTPPAWLLRRIDRRAFERASLVVADTEAQAAFFVDEFDLPRDRLAVSFVGAEDRLFRPGTGRDEPFHALFVGKLIPLHGVGTILEAARLSPEIRFRLVGSGQLQYELPSRPRNVDWVPWVEYVDLPALYQQAGCALGIFGTGDKASRVIPNKAFQALACARPLVTADTPAARELLTDGLDAVLVPPGDPTALAEAVRRLAADPAGASALGATGRATYEARACEDVLGARWKELLERLLRAQ